MFFFYSGFEERDFRSIPQLSLADRSFSSEIIRYAALYVFLWILETCKTHTHPPTQTHGLFSLTWLYFGLFVFIHACF